MKMLLFIMRFCTQLASGAVTFLSATALISSIINVPGRDLPQRTPHLSRFPNISLDLVRSLQLSPHLSESAQISLQNSPDLSPDLSQDLSPDLSGSLQISTDLPRSPADPALITTW